MLDRLNALYPVRYTALALCVLAALLLAMVAFVGTVAYCKFLLRGDIIE